MSTSRNQQVAEIIYSQIGGKAFYMLGAKNFVAVDNGLAFRIRGSKKVNYIKITLNGMDTYDMEFGKIRAGKYKVINTFNGAYNDMLRSIIEENTGLYTSL